MKARRHVRGFTLLEVMIVVAIIAILTVIAVVSVQRARGRLNAERASVALRGMIAEAQGVAAIAGSRIGTANLSLGAGCTGPANQVSVVVRSPTQIEVPVGVTSVGPPAVRVDCQVFDLTAATDGAVQLTQSGNFSIAPNGRLVNAATPTVQFQFTGVADPSRPFGFRVLSSGVMCQSSMPSPPALSLCDEDV